MIARAFLGTYSTHNTHIFYRHPIFELKIDNCSLRLIKFKHVKITILLASSYYFIITNNIKSRKKDFFT